MDQSRTCLQVESLFDLATMRIDSARVNRQGLCDLLGGPPLGDVQENLASSGCDCRLLLATLQGTVQRGRIVRCIFEDGFNGAFDLPVFGFLDHEASSPRVLGVEHLRSLGGAGQDDEFQPGLLFFPMGHHFEPTHRLHLQVRQDHVDGG